MTVALGLWNAEGRGGEGLCVGVVDGDVGDGLGGTQRTAQQMLNNKPDMYRKGLVNCLYQMSTYCFPEDIPFGLPSAAVSTNATYTTSQEKCSACGGNFYLVGIAQAIRVTAVSAPSL